MNVNATNFRFIGKCKKCGKYKRTTISKMAVVHLTIPELKKLISISVTNKCCPTPYSPGQRIRKI